MVTFVWDHTVHHVNDLENAIHTFKNNGLTAFKGGSHTQWGTHNALSYFGLSYVEFLGIENNEVATKADPSILIINDGLSVLPHHEIFGRVAFRTNDIEESAKLLKAHQLEVSPIMDGKRLDAKGNLIEWRMMTINGHFEGLHYPFIIQWKVTDGERLETLTETGVITPHSAGKVLLETAVFSVSNPVHVASHWHQIFGLTILESDERSATLEIGDQMFVFVKGETNRLEKLIFSADSPSLKGKTIVIGDADYVFL